jgi:predicted negative regulator of RcsB-dependent stress response
MLIANLAGQGKSEEVGLEQLLKLAPAAGANVPLFFKLFAYWRTAPTRRRTDMQAAIAELLAMRAEVHATLGTTHPIATAFEFHYAVLLLEQGNVREAERVGGAALNNLPRVLASNPLVAEPHCKFGQLLAARGNSLDAERHLREAMRLGAGRPIKGRRWDWEAAMSLANLKHAQGDVRAAEQLVRDALHAPDNTHLREGAHRTLLPLLLDLGQFQEAVEIARHYYTMFWPQRANDPEVAVYWSQVYAQCLRDQADYGTLRWIETEALAFVRDYLSQRESDLSRGGVRRLAQFLTEQSDFSAAERLWNISLEQSRNAHRPESPALAADLASVAEYFRDRAQFNQAQPLWEETVRISSAQLGSDHLTTTGVQLQLALTELAMELPEESLARARAAYETRLEAQGADDLRTHAAARTLAQVLLAQKQFDEAEKLLHAAAAFHAQRLPPTDSRLWQAHVDLADLYLAKADYAAAVSFLQSSRDTLQPALAPRSWRLAEIESRLGQAFSTQNRFSEAEPLLFHSFAVLREAWSSADQRFRQARDRLLTHYEATGNHPSAESLRSQFP